jgi:hypothetical protein
MSGRPDDLLKLVQFIVNGQVAEVSRVVAAHPQLATLAFADGATRASSTTFFFPSIAHYLLRGDTALHMAAAAFSRPAAELLIAAGADCRARNRRGAEPLHYASDANHWSPAEQAETITYLISVGADPHAVDDSGVAPLHRAVRTRSSAAVEALLEAGAKVRQPNRSGSTPLHLAVQTTGRSGSGTPQAREEQGAIIKLLLAAGARVTDRDGTGRQVDEAARGDWVLAALRG